MNKIKNNGGNTIPMGEFIRNGGKLSVGMIVFCDPSPREASHCKGVSCPGRMGIVSNFDDAYRAQERRCFSIDCISCPAGISLKDIAINDGFRVFRKGREHDG